MVLQAVARRDVADRDGAHGRVPIVAFARQGQRPIARSTAVCSSGESATDGRSPLDVLHVDPRVVPSLDRRHDRAGPGCVQERERGRLLAARVLVRVVAHDGGVRDRSVDAPVDPRQPRRDLVDRAMEIVDPRLQRDGELDHVVGGAAENGLLGALEPAQPAARAATT